MIKVDQQSLFERIGEEKLQRVAADILARRYANPAARRRYEAIQDKATAERRVFEFIATGTGGPFEYFGRDLLTAPEGSSLGEQEFFEVMDDIIDALRENSVGEAEQREVLRVLYGWEVEPVRV